MYPFLLRTKETRKLTRKARLSPFHSRYFGISPLDSRRGGGRKFIQSLLMVLVLEGEQLCSQNLLFNLGVFRQQEVRPPPPLVVL